MCQIKKAPPQNDVFLGFPLYKQNLQSLPETKHSPTHPPLFASGVDKQGKHWAKASLSHRYAQTAATAFLEGEPLHALGYPSYLAENRSPQTTFPMTGSPSPILSFPKPVAGHTVDANSYKSA